MRIQAIHTFVSINNRTRSNLFGYIIEQVLSIYVLHREHRISSQNVQQRNTF